MAENKPNYSEKYENLTELDVNTLHNMNYKVYYNWQDADNFVNECVLETSDKKKAIHKAYNSPLYVKYHRIDVYKDGVYQESLKPHQIEDIAEEYGENFLKDMAEQNEIE